MRLRHHRRPRRGLLALDALLSTAVTVILVAGVWLAVRAALAARGSAIESAAGLPLP